MDTLDTHRARHTTRKFPMEPVEDPAPIIRQVRKARRQGTMSATELPKFQYTIPVSGL